MPIFPTSVNAILPDNEPMNLDWCIAHRDL